MLGHLMTKENCLNKLIVGVVKTSLLSEKKTKKQI